MNDLRIRVFRRCEGDGLSGEDCPQFEIAAILMDEAVSRGERRSIGYGIDVRSAVTDLLTCRRATDAVMKVERDE